MTAKNAGEMAIAMQQADVARFDSCNLAEAHAMSLTVHDESLEFANSKFATDLWFSRPWLACVFQYEFDLTDAEASFIKESIMDDYQTSDSSMLHALATQLRRLRRSGVAERAVELLADDATSVVDGNWDDLSGYLRCLAFVPLAAISDEDRCVITAFWDTLPTTAPSFVAAMSGWLDEYNDISGVVALARTIERLLAIDPARIELAAIWLLSTDAKNTEPTDVISSLEHTVTSTAALGDDELRILKVLATESMQPFGELIAAARALAATAV